jgi:hypothetical protein
MAWKYPVGWRVALLLWIALAVGSAQGDEQFYDWTRARELYPSIHYVRQETACPDKVPPRMMVHALRIDTEHPDLQFHTTRRREEWVEGKAETDRRTTRNFLLAARERGVPMVVAINADAFSPWPAPFDRETPTDLLGLAVSDGTLVSRGSGTPSLVRTKSGQWRIEVTHAAKDSADLELAVSGFALCLVDGQAVAGGSDLHPRTGLGLCADNRHIVAVVIDGRQPGSAGATTEELGRWLRHFGARQGINMDGGGSTTMVWWDPTAPDDDKSRLLNSPVGSGRSAALLPAAVFTPTERANGNNFGVSSAPARDPLTP